MDKKTRGRPPGKRNSDPLARATPYTLWLRTGPPHDAPAFVVEDSSGYADSALAVTARRIGVKVVTSKGVAVYGRETVNVVRVTKVIE